MTSLRGRQGTTVAAAAPIDFSLVTYEEPRVYFSTICLLNYYRPFISQGGLFTPEECLSYSEAPILGSKCIEEVGCLRVRPIVAPLLM